MFLQVRPRSTQKHITESMKGVFDKCRFVQDDIIKYRSDFKGIVALLEKEWKVLQMRLGEMLCMSA